MSKPHYKAVVIQVIHSSKSSAKEIKGLITSMLDEKHVSVMDPDVWAVSGTAENPAAIAQQQLEERYPGASVAVLGKRNDDLSTKCKFIIDPNSKHFIYLCSVEPGDGFEPVYNDDIYYVNLMYEVNPMNMELTYGQAAKDMIVYQRRFSERFDTGEDYNTRTNCSDYVISPLLNSGTRFEPIGNKLVKEIPAGDKFFVEKLLFDIFNGCNRCSDVIRQLLFEAYEDR